METALINDFLDHSSPDFVSKSSSHPVQSILDVVYGNQIFFRSFGKANEESIIFLPGLYESCSSSIFLLDLLESYGYCCYSIELNEYKTIKRMIKGFLQFCARENIKKCHLIGSDYGGFQILQIASYEKLKNEVEIKSIILINSFVSVNNFAKLSLKTNIFGKLGIKSLLYDEIKNIRKVNEDKNMIKTFDFITKEIDFLDSENVYCKLIQRASKTLPINLHFSYERIMTIETLDNSFNIPDAILPSNYFSKCKVAFMKYGGNWPHVSNAFDTLNYVFVHLKNFGYIPKLNEMI